MSILKKLAGETVIYGFSNIASRLINFLLVPYYTRVLVNTADYGIVNVMYGYVGLLLVFFTYRLETGFFRFGSSSPELKEKTFSTTMISLLTTTPIFVTLFILFAQPIAELINYPDHTRYIIWFALIIGMDTLTRIPLAKIRLDSKPKRFLLVQMTNIFVNVGANLFFINGCPWLIDLGYEWPKQIYDSSRLVDYVFISNLLASAVMLIMLLPEIFSIRRIFDVKLYKNILAYVWPLIFVGIAAIINETLDRPMLEWLLDGTQEENQSIVGIYSANYKLAMLMTIITQGFNYAAEPFFFKNKERDDVKSLYGVVGQAFAFIGSIAFVGIMLYLSLALEILGPKYNQGGHDIIPFILMANLCLGLYYNFSIWFKLSDKTIIGMYIAIFGAILTLSMNCILIPKVGYIAAAWTTLTCYFTMATLAYLLGQKYYPINYPIGRIFTYIVLALGAYTISVYLNHYLDFIGKETLFINTFIFLIFIVIMYFLEKDHLFRKILKG